MSVGPSGSPNASEPLSVVGVVVGVGDFRHWPS
jgi:hypothetical protein